MKMVGSLARSANVLTPDVRVGDQHLRVLLEDRRDLDHRNVLLDRREGADQVALHVELDLVGQQQRLVGGLRAALDDRDLQPVFLVGAVGDRLVEAAVLAFGQPVGAEGDLVEILRRRLAGERGRGAGEEARDHCLQDGHVAASPLPCCWRNAEARLTYR